MNKIFTKETDGLPLRIFEEISEIPRGTGNEKAISDYLYNRAKEHGLDVIQDDCQNIIVKKPASIGYEKAAPVILQAHMDMDCEMAPDTDHDFRTDPITLVRDGGRLMARGTTLGADDGIGVAMCFAALETPGLAHPPLEVLITTGQGNGFTGASHIDPALFSARRMINIDCPTENEIMVGSCAGASFRVKLPLEREPVTGDMGKSLRICISGLTGGHSGEDIHKGLPTANDLMTRVLLNLRSKHKLHLVHIEGGDAVDALSRDCNAIVMTDAHLSKELDALEEMFEHEFSDLCPGLTITREAAPQEEECYTEESFAKILAMMALCPNGVRAMDGRFPGTVASSCNMGVLRETENSFILETRVRGTYRTTVQDVCDRIGCLAAAVGGTIEQYDDFAPWEYAPDSALSRITQWTYKEMFGETMTEVMAHGGLECGILKEQLPGLDAISIGPTILNQHSPSETLMISSAERMWEFLQQLLKNL